ncbi:MAG: tryptophan-rich sensory protein [Alphaproteobacteria bacterium]|nr:tryptophan-rich sensory protein [Alphaproteobacteria bacterium]
MKRFFKFILAIFISFLPGIFGVMFTPSHSNDVWYNALNNSSLTPAGWMFGVAWTILYFLLGIALFLIMDNTKTRQNKTKAYTLFVVQMVLNALWTYLFFGLHMVAASVFCLIVLLGISVWMAYAFKPISKPAAYLVWPYILWMCFALYLNGTIYVLN